MDGEDYPVVASMTVSKSTVLYSIAMPNTNAVMNPIVMVLKRARGTVLAASVTSSARWTAPSMPANMKLGLAMPVKKTTASELQPLLLTKFVHTNSDVR